MRKKKVDQNQKASYMKVLKTQANSVVKNVEMSFLINNYTKESLRRITLISVVIVLNPY